MAKNKYKIGCSKDTPQKLDDFEYLMRRLLAISSNVIKRNTYLHQEIVVIDWNAASGRYRGVDREVLEGTPLITARLAQRSEIPVFLLAVEGNHDSCDQLEMELYRYESPKFAFKILRGQNDQMVSAAIEVLDGRRNQHRIRGVHVFDPNGRPEEDLLKELQDWVVVADLDVLAHYSTAYIKWLRSVKVTQARTKQLSEYLYDLHSKQYWSIQRPRRGYRQAAWFLGSDWSDLATTMKPVDMVNIDSKEGQALFDELERTKKERRSDAIGATLFSLD